MVNRFTSSLLGLLLVWGVSTNLQAPRSHHVKLLKTAISPGKGAVKLQPTRWKIADPLVRDLALWVTLERGKPTDPKDVVALLARRRKWPMIETFRARLERQLYEAGDFFPALLPFFQKHAPVTPEGKLVFLALQRRYGRRANKAAVRAFCKNAWRQTVWSDGQQEARFLAYARPFLSPGDHHVRAIYLVKKRDREGLARLMPRLSDTCAGRMRLSLGFLANTEGALERWKKAPSAQARDELVLWSYMRWLMGQKKYRQVPAVFALLPNRLTHPLLFYRVRVMAARELMEMQQYTQAAQLLAAHGLSSKNLIEYADLLWHQAWLWLCFLDNPVRAKGYLDQFLRVVKTPISLSRGHYWMGHLHDKRKESAQAMQAYRRAAQHRGSFYGQLAAMKVGRKTAPRLRAFPQLTAKDCRFFEQRELVRAVRLLQQLGREGYATVKTFIRHLEPQMRTRWERYLLLRLARQTHPSAFVDVARSYWVKSAGLPLMEPAYPLCPLPKISQAEQAEALGIIYKETRFDPTIEGDAGERGLMQVMLHTARQEAKAMKVSHTDDKLYDPAHNVLLGLAHFRRHKERFGHTPVAISAYNAGGGAVSGWMKTIGSPDGRVMGKWFPDKDERMLQWLEAIPYESTRGYVQRFLEAKVIYHGRLGQRRVHPLWGE